MSHYDNLKDKQVDEDLLKKEKELTSCCKAKQGFHKGEWVCFYCGMPYKTPKGFKMNQTKTHQYGSVR
jgi:hypothetical protein